MPADGAVIEVLGLTKNFGSLRAVDDLSFDVQPERRHRFPRTERRGQDDDAAHAARPGDPGHRPGDHRGRRYVELPDPTRTVGAALEASSFHPGRRARDHIRVICRGAGLRVARGRRAHAGWSQRRGVPTRRRLLDGHAPTAGARRRARRRSSGSHPRRARQRLGSGGHRLAARLPPLPSRPGAYGPDLQPCCPRSRRPWTRW